MDCITADNYSTVAAAASDSNKSIISESLPEFTTELLRVHSLQVNDLQTMYKELQLLKERIGKEELNHKDRKREIFEMTRQLRLLSEDKIKLNSSCTEKNEDLEKKVSQIHKLKKTQEKLQEERDTEVSVYDEYQQKMSAYITSAVAENNNSSCAGLDLQIQNLEETVSSLKQERDELTNNKQAANGKMLTNHITTKMNQMHQQKAVTVKKNEELQLLVRRLENVSDNVSCEISIGKKRNRAQLTRLHYQLKEADTKHNQWLKEKQRLERAIKKNTI